MTPKTTATPTIALGARAAGYCGEWHPNGKAFCTKRPDHMGTHVSHYRGKKAITDVEGFVWTS
ncbi:hypothetical protein [Streptomyces diastatochromogenes]|uniref:hypothetical protein n=1 Tax=Streptomyces diastatochromogenes TaxID=42236 RepID=UPI0036A6AA83